MFVHILVEINVEVPKPIHKPIYQLLFIGSLENLASFIKNIGLHAVKLLSLDVRYLDVLVKEVALGVA